jgi:hypothetical protein
MMNKVSAEGVAGHGEPCIEGGYWLRMALTNSVPLSALRKIVRLLMVSFFFFFSNY